MEPVNLSIIALAFTVVSLTTMLYSTLDLKKIKKNDQYIFKKSEPVELLRYKIIAKWNEVESVLFKLNEPNDKKYGYSILVSLYKAKIIEADDYEKLKKLLQIRNGLVHSNGPEYSSEELLTTLEIVDEVVERLRKK